MTKKRGAQKTRKTRKSRKASGSPVVERHELTVDEAVRLAVERQKAGHLDEAEKVYGQVLANHPEHPDALHFLGVLRHQQKRSDEAVDLIRRSIAAAPGYVDAQNNLGNVLVQTARFAEAVAVYEQVLTARPDFASAWNNLGVALGHLGRTDDSVTALRRAVDLAADYADAYFNLGNSLKRQGRSDEAITAYTRSVRIECNDWPAFRNLGNTLYAAGRIADAADVYRSWLEREPDHPIALHMLAACTGTGIPERASNAYVAKHFDSFSKSFDEVLAALKYRAPELVAEALRRERPDAAAALDVLDAGCGTGLCGPLLRPLSRRLAGVDLSAGMLAKAKDRNAYDDLVEAELTEHLSGSPRAFDAVVSADTLVYFGRLDPAFAAAATALRPGGLFVFTVEATSGADPDGGYRMETHGRYTHAEPYVRRTLEASGFSVRSCTGETLRMERGVPVAGLLVVAERTA